MQDIAALYAFLFEREPVNAERYVEGLHKFMLRIADLGITGIPRPHISAGLRLMIFKAHAVYFRVEGGRILVLRVLHTSQDADKNLLGD